MSTDETSILEDIHQSVVKKRRFLMLPAYARIIIILFTIFGGFLLAGVAIQIISAMWEGNPLMLFPALLGTALAGIYFIGYLFILLERRYAIGWAYASSVLGILLALGMGKQMSVITDSPALFIVTALPLAGLHSLLFIVFSGVSQDWKTIGASKSELK